jgi:hypothetical protein
MPQPPSPACKSHRQTGPRRRTVCLQMRSAQATRRHIAKHLCKVDRNQRGESCRSIRLYIKECNKAFPKTIPSVLPLSLKKRVTLATRKQRKNLPWPGGAFWYFGDPRNKEINNLTTKPRLPPAPNINTRLPQPPQSQGGCALDTTTAHFLKSPTEPIPSPFPNIDITIATFGNKEPMMMRLRSSGGKAADMARKLEENCQMNKKNYQKQRQQEETCLAMVSVPESNFF